MEGLTKPTFCYGARTVQKGLTEPSFWCTFVYMKEILLYKTDNEEVKVEILLHNENLWLTQAKMAELFDVQKAAISKHLKNIFESGELDEKVVVSKMETTTPHGAIAGKEQTKLTNIYNLDAIIAVGYRINSKKATMFRIWATYAATSPTPKGIWWKSGRSSRSNHAF